MKERKIKELYVYNYNIITNKIFINKIKVEESENSYFSLGNNYFIGCYKTKIDKQKDLNKIIKELYYISETSDNSKYTECLLNHLKKRKSKIEEELQEIDRIQEIFLTGNVNGYEYI